MPGKTKFTMYQGSTFKHTLTYEADGTPVDLTGCTIIMKVKPNTGATLTFSTVTGEIELVAPLEGKFRITVTDEVTDTYTWVSAKFDIHIGFTNGEVETLLEGTMKLRPRVA